MDTDGKIAQIRKEQQELRAELFTPKSGQLRKHYNAEKIVRYRELSNYLDVMDNQEDAQAKQEKEQEVLAELAPPSMESINELPWDLRKKANMALRGRKVRHA